MGLDNGIIIKAKSENGLNFLRKNFSDLKAEFDDEGREFEFGYWRKCWNIRSKFLEDFWYNEENYEIRFSIDDIPEIIETLEFFVEEKNWTYGNGSIFEWSDEIKHLLKVIRDLKFFYLGVKELINLNTANDEMLREEDFEIFFYDSY